MNSSNITLINNSTESETEESGAIFLWSFVTLSSMGLIGCCILKIRNLLREREDRKLTEWLTTRHVVK